MLLKCPKHFAMPAAIQPHRR